MNCAEQHGQADRRAEKLEHESHQKGGTPASLSSCGSIPRNSTPVARSSSLQRDSGNSEWTALPAARNSLLTEAEPEVFRSVNGDDWKESFSIRSPSDSLTCMSYVSQCVND